MDASSRNARNIQSDTRLQDYLDDKLQSLADLETLDSLLANVQSQQDLLRKQVHNFLRQVYRILAELPLVTEGRSRASRL